MKMNRKNLALILLVAGLTVTLNSGISLALEKTTKFKDGYLILEDTSSGATEKIKLPSTISKILHSANSKRYLLSYQDTQKPCEIYNSDGAKIAAIALTGETIDISDDGNVIAKTMDTNNTWKVFDETGLEVFKMPKELSVEGAKFIDSGKLLMWGKNSDHYSAIAVLDMTGDKLYEKTFGDSAIKIENITTGHSGFRFILFTSKEGYHDDVQGGHSYEYDRYNQYGYDEKDVTISIIDYLQGTLTFNNLLTSNQDISLHADLSENNNVAAVVINNSDLFLIEGVSGNIRSHKPLAKKINGAEFGEVIQVKTTNDGNAHILRYYAQPTQFVAYEVHDMNGDMAQIHIIDDMDSEAKISIDGNRVDISGKNKIKTIYQ